MQFTASVITEYQIFDGIHFFIHGNQDDLSPSGQKKYCRFNCVKVEQTKSVFIISYSCGKYSQDAFLYCSFRDRQYINVHVNYRFSTII